MIHVYLYPHIVINYVYSILNVGGMDWRIFADRHSIGTNGGYWIYQIPSKPSRGIYVILNFTSSNILLGSCDLLII